MKKHIALFGTTLLLGSLLGGTGVLAEEDNHNTPNPASAQTTVQGSLDLSADGGFNPNPPSGNLNTKNEVGESYFGISYQPNNFNIGTTVNLADTNEEQHIVMQGQTDSPTKESFHVGVKDKTRSTNRGWILKAKLEQDIDQEGLGISVKSNTSMNSVKRNMNDGSEQFQDKDLINQIQKDGSSNEVTNTVNLEITTSDAEVMKAEDGKFVNGVYDLELPEVELYIPDASKVKAQKLNTKVIWTLTNAAQ